MKKLFIKLFVIFFCWPLLMGISQPKNEASLNMRDMFSGIFSACGLESSRSGEGGNSSASEPAGFGTVEGLITDAENGNDLTGATVYVSGKSGTLNDTTVGDGNYSIANVPAGTATIVATKTGYQDGQVNAVTVTADQTTSEVNISLLPNSLATNMYAVVVTWNDLPKDLDAHLWVPAGPYFEVYYPVGNKGNINVSPHATLDEDDVNGNGPETVTIRTYVNGSSGDVNCTNTTVGNACFTGTYRFFVHRFDDNNIVGAGAVATVYKNGTQVKQYTLPTSGTGAYWYIFDLSNTTITDVNQVCAGPITSGGGGC